MDCEKKSERKSKLANVATAKTKRKNIKNIYIQHWNRFQDDGTKQKGMTTESEPQKRLKRTHNWWKKKKRNEKKYYAHCERNHYGKSRVCVSTSAASLSFYPIFLNSVCARVFFVGLCLDWLSNFIENWQVGCYYITVARLDCVSTVNCAQLKHNAYIHNKWHKFGWHKFR